MSGVVSNQTGGTIPLAAMCQLIGAGQGQEMADCVPSQTGMIIYNLFCTNLTEVVRGTRCKVVYQKELTTFLIFCVPVY